MPVEIKSFNFYIGLFRDSDDSDDGRQKKTFYLYQKQNDVEALKSAENDAKKTRRSLSSLFRIETLKTIPLSEPEKGIGEH